MDGRDVWPQQASSWLAEGWLAAAYHSQQPCLPAANVPTRPTPLLACSSSSTLVQSLKVDRSRASPCRRGRPSCRLSTASVCVCIAAAAIPRPVLVPQAGRGIPAVSVVALHQASFPAQTHRLAAPPRLPAGPAFFRPGHTPRCAHCIHSSAGMSQFERQVELRLAAGSRHLPHPSLAQVTGLAEPGIRPVHLRAATVISRAGSMARFPSG